jgi:DNA-binding NtrC family response regulator
VGYLGRVLVVDDEPSIRKWLCAVLQQAGHSVVESATGTEALKSAANADVALVDLVMPDTDGLKLMSALKSQNDGLIVMIMTAHSDVKTAVRAVKMGAYDYLCKPLGAEEVAATVGRAAEASALRRHVGLIRGREKLGLKNFLGESRAVEQVLRLSRKIAQSEATTILLRGESGVGKDHLARAIHFESRRADGPFQTITCTTLQETLLESELFGHERGAFTDARSQKRGLVELANGGTVYLDEIGDIPPTLQAKLLRFLEDKSFRRVGGTIDLKADVRVIAATNRDLEEAIKAGRFRKDLYYRLNVMPIRIPPLSERPEDIPILGRHFAVSFSRDFKKNVEGLSDEALRMLVHYPWPGNIRELRNVMERAVLLSTGTVIEPEDLLISAPSPEPGAVGFQLPAGGIDIEELERSMVAQALERTAWNQSAAARLLRLTRNQIRYRIKKFLLAPPARQGTR